MSSNIFRVYDFWFSKNIRNKLKIEINCRFAHYVRLGDHVLIQQNDQIVLEKVIDVSSLGIQGNYMLCPHVRNLSH